jgi:subtilisin-like proprotein convertase family protein
LADPGETVRIPVTLLNTGVAAASVVSGRLTAPDPSAARILEPDATWPDIPTGMTEESTDPHFELTVSEDVPCGGSLELQLDVDAADTTTRSRQFQLGFGAFDRDLVNNEPRYIPADTVVPVTSTIEMPAGHTLGELDVSVRIEIFEANSLMVDLGSPGGTTVRLHDRSDGFFGIDTRYDLLKDPDGPGTMDDFIGESTAGTWTLTIRNEGGIFGSSGTLLSWTLHATALEPFDCDPYACPEPTPTQSANDLRVDRVGPGASDLMFSWSGVAGAAGYHVLASAAAEYTGAVELTGRTDGATTLTVADVVVAPGGLTFYQVRAINACNQEGP